MIEESLTAMNARLFEQVKDCRTLPEFLTIRAKYNPEVTALRQFDRSTNNWFSVTYSELVSAVERWRRALAAMKLAAGSRVAILLPNSVFAMVADQAVLANALVPVPLHVVDTPGSLAYCIKNSEAACLITGRLESWTKVAAANGDFPDLKRVIFTEEAKPTVKTTGGPKLVGLEDWLACGHGVTELPSPPTPDDLAAIVYTSGTTGKPKGVMLTHGNVTADVIASLKHIAPYPVIGHVFLSFLPLSHTFERTCDYLALGMGSTITFNRSILLLAEDLRKVRPHVLISVPRIYERIYARLNEKLGRAPAYVRFMFNAAVSVGWRKFCRENKLPVPQSPWSFLDPLTQPILQKLVADKMLKQFGGRLKIAIAGGAAMNGKVSRVFAGLGLAPIQGYGMTEASPIIAGNSLKINQPETVGVTLPGVRMRLDPETREIQISGPTVMKGYWKLPAETAKVLSPDGWLSTGDIGAINEHGLLHICGRIKEIIVTSTGEKVPPVDLELAFETDPLFAQTYVIGENRSYITLIAVLNGEEWKKLATKLEIDPEDPGSLKLPAVRFAVLKRAKQAAAGFPNYALPRNVTLTLDPWTINNGTLTPTLKIKRRVLSKLFEKEIEDMYKGHG